MSDDSGITREPEEGAVWVATNIWLESLRDVYYIIRKEAEAVTIPKWGKTG